MTVQDFIKRLGGATAVSRELGVPMTTVATWTQRNSIPSWRMASLAALALHKGIDVPASFAEAA